jgi:hypothetical protein
VGEVGTDAGSLLVGLVAALMAELTVGAVMLDEMFVDESTKNELCSSRSFNLQVPTMASYR